MIFKKQLVAQMETASMTNIKLVIIFSLWNVELYPLSSLIRQTKSNSTCTNRKRIPTLATQTLEMLGSQHICEMKLKKFQSPHKSTTNRAKTGSMNPKSNPVILQQK